METKIKKFLSDHPDFDAFDLELFIKKELNQELDQEQYEIIIEKLIGGKINLINSLFFNGTVISIDSDTFKQDVKIEKKPEAPKPVEKEVVVEKKEKPVDIIEIDPSLVLDIDISEFKDMEYDMDFIKSLEVDHE
jgi:hypothetical protein